MRKFPLPSLSLQQFNPFNPYQLAATQSRLQKSANMWTGQINDNWNFKTTNQKLAQPIIANIFQDFSSTSKVHWLWPSARHLKEVTVTAFKWRSLEKWLADGQGSDVTWSDVTRNFWNFFFTFFWHFGQFQTFTRKKNFKNFEMWRHFWSDGQMAKEVTSLEVTVIWKKWRHFFQVTSRW